jgi:hypothetical protein
VGGGRGLRLLPIGTWILVSISCSFNTIIYTILVFSLTGQGKIESQHVENNLYLWDYEDISPVTCSVLKHTDLVFESSGKTL